jgi:hypothetical protein
MGVRPSLTYDMKPIRPIAVLPTLFTLGNLICGFFAIVVLSRIEKPLTTEIDPAPRIELKLESAKELRESAKELIGSEDPTHPAGENVPAVYEFA